MQAARRHEHRPDDASGQGPGRRERQEAQAQEADPMRGREKLRFRQPGYRAGFVVSEQRDAPVKAGKKQGAAAGAGSGPDQPKMGVAKAKRGNKRGNKLQNLSVLCLEKQRVAMMIQ